MLDFVFTLWNLEPLKFDWSLQKRRKKRDLFTCCPCDSKGSQNIFCVFLASYLPSEDHNGTLSVMCPQKNTKANKYVYYVKLILHGLFYSQFTYLTNHSFHKDLKIFCRLCILSDFANQFMFQFQSKRKTIKKMHEYTCISSPSILDKLVF